MAALIFWGCFTLLAWTFLLYPVGMLARAGLVRRGWVEGLGSRPRPLAGPSQLVASTSLVASRLVLPESSPNVSVVLPVRDGARWLNGRIRSLLEQDYASERLEVVVVCNGCKDRSEAIARARAEEDPRLLALTSPAEEGRAGALNRGVAAASGELIVFANVRQHFELDTIARLVAALGEPGVGAVTGRLVVGGSRHSRPGGLSRYREIDTLLRIAESETGSVVGATGAIYAIRKGSYQPIPPGTLLDDLYLPVRIALAGERVTLEPRAVARDVPTGSVAREYYRRVRTLLGTLQLLRLVPRLMWPPNTLFVRFLSHNLLRVLSPVFFLGLVLAGLWAGQGLYLIIAAGLLLLYLAGIVGLLVPRAALAIPAAFVLARRGIPYPDTALADHRAPRPGPVRRPRRPR